MILLVNPGYLPIKVSSKFNFLVSPQYMNYMDYYLAMDFLDEVEKKQEETRKRGRVPIKYVPKRLTRKDKKKARRELKKSRKAYKKESIIHERK